MDIRNLKMLDKIDLIEAKAKNHIIKLVIKAGYLKSELFKN